MNEDNKELLPTFYDLTSMLKLLIIFALTDDDPKFIKNIIYNGVFLYSLVRVLSGAQELKKSEYSIEGQKVFDFSMAKGLFFFALLLSKYL